ncbi:hypothetical protein SNE40_004205 [Patella caerulea]|uniref:G-protein coupled receptors family 2 profile 2 domain-containing protein n=1 Tax=Patella caerulea TaxID=87958 RepID=A0AAN8KCS9_PATCE
MFRLLCLLGYIAVNTALLQYKDIGDDLVVLKYCPECKPRNETKATMNNPLCVKCMCDLDCIQYGDCCIDVMIDLGLHLQEPTSHQFSCISPELETFMSRLQNMDSGNNMSPIVETMMLKLKNMNSFMDGYYMKTQFLEDNGSINNCSRLPLPVTCRVTGNTYINMECAFLNKDVDCIHWNLQSECDKRNPIQKCQSYLIPPDFAELRYCDARRVLPIISQCLPYMRDFDEPCAKYFYPVYDKEFIVYRNIFCYICNNNSMSEVAGPSVPTLDILTRFTVPLDHCGKDAWMDYRVNKCRQIRCSTSKRLDDDFCEYDNKTAFGNSYHLLVKLDLWTSDRIPFLKQFILDTMTKQSFEIMTSSYHMSYSNQIKIQGNSFVYINIWFTVNSNISLEDYERFILGFELTSLGSFWYGFRFMAKSNHSIVKFELGNLVPNSTTSLCCAVNNGAVWYKDHYESVTHQLMCSYIEFDANEYVLRDMTARIFHHNVTLIKEEYSIFNDQLRVCFHVFLERIFRFLFEFQKRPPVEADAIKSYVSIFCITLSLIALLLTFITYLKFRDMRTQPGKNNMALTITLFLAQVMLMISGTPGTNTIFCQVMGITLHYSWLSMLFWMNVCSYHMFKVFVSHNLTRMENSNGIRQTLIYLVYANGTPILIIVANIVTNYILSDGTLIGYGGNICYLSTPTLVLYCFVLPLGIVILTNIIFFLWTICTIHRVKQSGKQTGDRNNIFVYLKLSVVTGCFWLFAILSNVVNSPVMDYISISLNSCQGIFLFWSFVLNKTVINKFRNPAHRAARSSQRNGTRSTDDSIIRETSLSSSVSRSEPHKTECVGIEKAFQRIDSIAIATPVG